MHRLKKWAIHQSTKKLRPSLESRSLVKTGLSDAFY